MWNKYKWNNAKQILWVRFYHDYVLIKNIVPVESKKIHLPQFSLWFNTKFGNKKAYDFEKLKFEIKINDTMEEK